MNVGITRAKHCMFIVCNTKQLERNEVWRALIRDARQRNCCSFVRSGRENNRYDSDDTYMSNGSDSDQIREKSKKSEKSSPWKRVSKLISTEEDEAENVLKGLEFAKTP